MSSVGKILGRVQHRALSGRIITDALEDSALNVPLDIQSMDGDHAETYLGCLEENPFELYACSGGKSAVNRLMEYFLDRNTAVRGQVHAALVLVKMHEPTQNIPLVYERFLKYYRATDDLNLRTMGRMLQMLSLLPAGERLQLVQQRHDGEDIYMLVEHILGRYASEEPHKPPDFEMPCMQAFSALGLATEMLRSDMSVYDDHTLMPSVIEFIVGSIRFLGRLPKHSAGPVKKALTTLISELFSVPNLKQYNAYKKDFSIMCVLEFMFNENEQGFFMELINMDNVQEGYSYIEARCRQSPDLMLKWRPCFELALKRQGAWVSDEIAAILAQPCSGEL